MTIQFPAVMPAGGEGAALGAPVETAAEGFAAMIDALIAALTEDAAGGAGGLPIPEPAADDTTTAVADATALIAEFVMIPGGTAAAAAPAVVVSIGPASGPGAVLPGCGCCSGQSAQVPDSEPTPVPAVPDSSGGGFEGVASGTAADPAVPAARAAAPSMLTTQIVERVVELVQRQQAVTPPSTMVIELPEIAGARIAVTMHSGGVHLAFTGLGSSDLNPLIPQLQSGLAAAGMSLAGWSADPDAGQNGDGSGSERGDRENPNGDGEDSLSFADLLGI